MSFNPEIHWPDYITGFDGIQCGVYWCIDAYSKYRRRFGKVIEVDCSDIDHTVHVSEATALVVKILEFSNESYLELKIWVPGTGTTEYSPCAGKIRYYDKHGNLITNPNIGSDYNMYGRGASGDFAVNEIILHLYKAKLFFTTDYGAYQTPPVENVTIPYAFILTIAFPTELIGDYEAYMVNDLKQISDGVIIGQNEEDPPIEYYNWMIPPIGYSLIYTTDPIAFIQAMETACGKMKDITTGSEPNPSGTEDPSEPGGGGGDYTGGDPSGKSDYDNNSDPIDFPDLPSGGALSTGAIKGFVVGSQTIYNMFQSLWNTSIFDIETYQKLLQEPLDAMISLHCLPYTPSNGASSQIKLGNFDFSGAISAPIITSQYKTVSCGKLTIPLYWGSALDYGPYTKVEIYLPFIGIKQLKAENVIGFTLEIRYNCDVLSGDLTCNIKCGQSVLYKFQGNCKQTIPISSRVNESLATLIKGAGHVAVGAMAGGSVGAVSGAISAGVNTALTKDVVARSGDLAGNVGLLDEFCPYLIIHRPVQSLAQNFRTFKGYTSNITYTLSALNGYTEVEHIHLTGIDGATDTELNEIEDLLKNGVII